MAWDGELRLESIALGDVDVTGFTTTLEGDEIIDILDSAVEFKESLGLPTEITMRVFSSAAAVIKSRFQPRKVLRFTYNGASPYIPSVDPYFRDFRITSINRDLKGEDSFVITARERWADLEDVIYRRFNADTNRMESLFRYNVGGFDNLAEDVLVYFSDNSDTQFNINTVPNTEIDVEINTMNCLEVINKISQEIGYEYECHLLSSGTYDVNFKVQIGSPELIADADKRPITMSPIFRSNRENFRVKNDSIDLFHSVVAISEAEGVQTTLADMVFAITSVTNVGALNTVTVRGTPFFTDNDFGAYSGLTYYFGNEDYGFYEIDEIVAPNILKVNNTVSGLLLFEGSLCYITLDNSAGEQTQSYGRAGANYENIERLFISDNVTPVHNLIRYAENETTDNFSGASNYDQGIIKVTCTGGAAPPTVSTDITLSRETGAQFRSVGDSSLKVVTTASGYGIKTSEIPVAGSTFQALWISLYVASGEVEISIEATNARESIFPNDLGQTVRVFPDPGLQTIQIAGLNGSYDGTGTLIIRVYAPDASAVFYLDAWTLVNNAVPFQWSPFMGANDLLYQADQFLFREGGDKPPEFEGSFYDRFFDDPVNFEEVRLGDYCLIDDDHQPGGTTEISDMYRVTELEYMDGGMDSRTFKRFKCEPRKYSLIRALTATQKKNNSEFGQKQFIRNSTILTL